jgi:ribosome-binding factor A
MSQRLLRVCELLKRELGAILQRDYAFDGVLVTVNSVDVTPDLKQGHVFIGVIGDQKLARRVIEKLNREHGAIQKRISSRVVLKNTAKLTFKLDDSVERGVHLLAVIQDVDALPTAPPEEETPLGDEKEEDRNA